jgi:chorismate-pyruvate lyase
VKLNHDPLLQKILDAPVGKVENTIKELLNCDVHLDIIEQNQESGSNFVRKITITAKDFPVVTATVNFDSEVIPVKILEELLRKKEGIGTILTRNNIQPERKVISLNFENDNKKVIRKYQLVTEHTVWFEISEEIRLDLINTSKNS